MLQCTVQYTGNYAMYFLFVMCGKFTTFPHITLFHGSKFYIRLEMLHSFIISRTDGSTICTYCDVLVNLLSSLRYCTTKQSVL